MIVGLTNFLLCSYLLMIALCHSHYRMYCIFAHVCLLHDRLYNRLKEGIDVLPWRCVDNSHPDFVKEAFKWNTSCGHDQKKMNAHINRSFTTLQSSSSSVMKMALELMQNFLVFC